MKLFNFANFGNDMEGFILIKADIEKHMLTNNQITENLSLEQFVTDIFANTIIYSSHNKTLPFTVLNGTDENYIIYTDINNDKLLLQEMLDALKPVSYDITKLTKLDLINTVNIDYSTDAFFIKDGAFYK